MFILILILFLGVLFGANAYIFVRLVQALPTLPMVAKVLVGVCMGVATCSLFLSMALRGSAMPAAL